MDLRNHGEGVESLADDAQFVVDVDAPRDVQALGQKRSRALGILVEVTDTEIHQTAGDRLAVSHAAGESEALVVEGYCPCFVPLVHRRRAVEQPRPQRWGSISHAARRSPTQQDPTGMSKVYRLVFTVRTRTEEE